MYTVGKQERRQSRTQIHNSRKMLSPLGLGRGGTTWARHGVTWQEARPTRVEPQHLLERPAAAAHTERNAVASLTGASHWPTWPEPFVTGAWGLWLPILQRDRNGSRKTASKQGNTPHTAVWERLTVNILRGWSERYCVLDWGDPTCPHLQRLPMNDSRWHDRTLFIVWEAHWLGWRWIRPKDLRLLRRLMESSRWRHWRLEIRPWRPTLSRDSWDS